MPIKLTDFIQPAYRQITTVPLRLQSNRPNDRANMPAIYQPNNHAGTPTIQRPTDRQVLHLTTIATQRLHRTATLNG